MCVCVYVYVNVHGAKVRNWYTIYELKYRSAKQRGSHRRTERTRREKEIEKKGEKRVAKEGKNASVQLEFVPVGRE